MKEPIRRLDDAQGKVRGYRVVVDGPRDASGKRKQVTKTVKTQREAREWLAQTRTTITKGDFVARSGVTLDAHLDQWLESRFNVKATTRANYRDALKPVRRRLGDRKLQSLKVADVDSLVAGMLDESLRTQGTKGAPLSPRSARLMVTVLAMALDRAVKDGLVGRNVARDVERPRDARATRDVWDAVDVGKFLKAADGDRLAGAWHLTLHGLRRGEALGLRWADVDLTEGLAVVCQNRVLIDGAVFTQDTKTAAGERTVPLSVAAVVALKRTKAQQAQERLAAGPAYQDSGLVVVEALGAPMLPRWYSDRFKALSRLAGVPVVRLHDARHAFGSHLLDQGVPLPIVSEVMGHASVNVTASVYAHALKEGSHGRVRAAMQAAGM